MNLFKYGISIFNLIKNFKKCENKKMKTKTMEMFNEVMSIIDYGNFNYENNEIHSSYWNNKKWNNNTINL